MGWGAGPSRASVQESLPGGSWSLQRGSLSLCSVALPSSAQRALRCARHEGRHQPSQRLIFALPRQSFSK